MNLLCTSYHKPFWYKLPKNVAAARVLGGAAVWQSSAGPESALSGHWGLARALLDRSQRFQVTGGLPVIMDLFIEAGILFALYIILNVPAASNNHNNGRLSNIKNGKQ
jgi:hypothetical protein